MLTENLDTFKGPNQIPFEMQHTVEELVTKVTNEKISTLINVKVSNIQYSRKLNFDKTIL